MGVPNINKRLKAAFAFLLIAGAGLSFSHPLKAAARPQRFPSASPAASPIAAVISVTLISASSAATTLRSLFPKAIVRVDSHANAIVIDAPPDVVQQMRTVVEGLDVRSPEQPTTEVIPLHVLRATDAVARVRPLYPSAHIQAASKSAIIVRARPQQVAEIKTLLANLDVAPPTIAPATQPADAVHVNFVRPRDVARSLENQIPHLRASVSGSSIVLIGAPDDIQKAKALIGTIDAPAFGSRYTQIYRLRSVDATSVGNLIAKSYGDVKITVDKDLNSIAVLATAAEHERIAAAIAQLDGQQGTQSGTTGSAAYGASNFEIVDLNSAMPGQNGSPSTSAQDIASAVQQALQGMAPDLRLTVPANSTSIILAGNPSSIRLAKDMIVRLDRQQPLVVLDTEVLEVSESAAKNIGLQFPGAVIQSEFSETQPTPNPFTGQEGRLIGLQAINRTPIQFSAALNLLVQHGNARVLADPRVTTLSGHTATIRAGDTINILTQTAGGVGTPVTQQLQPFNTGVTLDITPMVGPSGNVTVSLHPVVSSLAGLINGVPQISTRDTQTVVQLNDNETLVIGGLIQESTQRQISKLPLLGDLPLVGKLFQNDDVQSQRNELVIVVTPHVIKPGEPMPPPSATIALPTPAPLRTISPRRDQMEYPRAGPSPTLVPLPDGTALPTSVPTVLATPAPSPSAFAPPNGFFYGSAPADTFANENDPPQIFSVQFSPTVLHSGTLVTVSAMTTSNVRRLEIGYSGYMTRLSQIAPSKWQGVFNFNTNGISGRDQPLQLSLDAYNALGVKVSVAIPVTVTSL